MAKTNYFWDPISDNILQERDETGAVTAEYTTEPGLYGNVICQNRGGAESQFHFDSQGSTLAATDENQNVTDTFAYTSFGDPAERSGANDIPLQYIGEKGYYRDNLTGQYSMRRREYSAILARWSSLDPLGVRIIDINSYVYVTNRPFQAIDPSGMITIVPLSESLDHLICGETARIKWDFVLDSAAPCDGYLVQMITWRCAVDSTCRDCPTDTPSSNIMYWEAFAVSKGKTREKTVESGQYDYTDEAFSPAKDKVCGIRLMFGVVRFYCKDSNDPAANGVGTGDLGEVGSNPADPKSRWSIQRTYGEGACQISPNDLPSVGPDAPEFWKQLPVEASAYRHFGINWCCCQDKNCCPQKKRFVRGSAFPRSSDSTIP